jgi:hypothetical protein
VNRFAVDRPRFHRRAVFPGRERAKKAPTAGNFCIWPRAPAAMDGGKGERAEEKMIIEGAWILVIAVVTFAAIVTVVLLGSAKLYDPDRSHE